MTKATSKRYRLSVPDADTSVHEWLAAQINASASLRMLIREDIQQNGYTDVTCRNVEQGPKRGRPTLAEQRERALAEAQDTSEEATSMEPASHADNPQTIPAPKPKLRPPVQAASQKAAPNALEAYAMANGAGSMPARDTEDVINPMNDAMLNSLLQDASD